jgi:hypothetical protein
MDGHPFADVLTMPDEGVWTAERVISRISEGLRLTVRSERRPGPAGYRSSMPEVFREWEDFVGRDVGKGKAKVDRLEEWMAEIEETMGRRFTAAEGGLAEEALRWPVSYLADKPLQLDALWLMCLCEATDMKLERVLRRRRAIADRMVEARKASGAPDRITIYEEESQGAAAKVADWVNPKLAVAQSVRVKRLLVKSARIRLAREIRATNAVERKTYVRRCDVMPGRLFTKQRVYILRQQAAQSIAEGLAEAGVEVR